MEDGIIINHYSCLQNMHINIHQFIMVILFKQFNYLISIVSGLLLATSGVLNTSILFLIVLIFIKGKTTVLGFSGLVCDLKFTATGDWFQSLIFFVYNHGRYQTEVFSINYIWKEVDITSNVTVIMMTRQSTIFINSPEMSSKCCNYWVCI